MNARSPCIAGARLAAVVLVAVLLVPTTGAEAAIVEPGDLLVVDVGGSIKRVNRATGAISVVAAGGLLVAPVDVVVEQDGSLVVADSGYAPDVLIRIDAQTGVQSYLTSATTRGFDEPRSLALEADGTILVRSWNPRLVRVDPRTGVVTPAGDSEISTSFQGVDVAPDGSIYTVRTNAERGAGRPLPADVLRIDPRTGAATVVSTGGPLQEPGHLVVAADGTVVVTDVTSGRVIHLDVRSGAQGILTERSGFLFGVELDRDGSILVSETTYSGTSLQGSVIRVNPTTGAQTVLATETLASNFDQYYGLTLVAESEAGLVETSLQADPVELPMFQLRARLTETRSGTPLAGRIVTMSTAAGQVCQATTDANGVATCSGLSGALSMVLENGYTAAFAGSSDLGPSSSRTTLLAAGATPAPTPVREPDVTPRPTGPSRVPAIPPASGQPRGASLPLPAATTMSCRGASRCFSSAEDCSGRRVGPVPADGRLTGLWWAMRLLIARPDGLRSCGAHWTGAIPARRSQEAIDSPRLIRLTAPSGDPTTRLNARANAASER